MVFKSMGSKFFFIFITVLGSFFSLQSAFGGQRDSALTSLIDSAHRPTISELKKVLQPWPAKNPFKGSQNPTSYEFVDDLIEAVLSLEQAFPGGIYAEMGRDVVGLGDTLDAFYQSLGQTGRVARINGSAPTYQKATPEQILGFLKTSGFDINQMPVRPFILFDNSHYSESKKSVLSEVSQAVILVRTVYQKYREQGHDPLDLLEKFNFVNLNAIQSYRLGESFDRANFMAKAEDTVRAKGYPTITMSFRKPLRMISKGIVENSPGKGVLLYTLEWHGRFRELQENKDGTVTSTPGSSFDDNHEQILFNLYEIVNRLKKPDVLARLLARAQARRIPLSFDSTPELREKMQLIESGKVPMVDKERPSIQFKRWYRKKFKGI